MPDMPSKSEIAELVRRLEGSAFPVGDIREAGQILAENQPHAVSYKMALEFSDSKHAQVRQLGLVMMETVAPHFEAARGFMAGVKDAGNLLANGRLVPSDIKPDGPDYSAIGEVIKMWLRHSRENQGRGQRR